MVNSQGVIIYSPLHSAPMPFKPSIFWLFEIFSKIEVNRHRRYLFLVNFSEKTVLAVTILLRKVARCILGTRNWVLTLLRRQRETTFYRPAVGGWSFRFKSLYSR